MASRFLGKYDEEIQRVHVETGRETHDRRSYCANSDLFNNNMKPLATRELTKEEYERQAEIYRV